MNFKSNFLLCGWHIQKNMISKFSSLAKKDKSLYDKIINLPFIGSEEKFNTVLGLVEDSDDITKNEYDYLYKKLESKLQWVKCFTKENFCGGVSTTSRIEGLHGVLKKHLNSNSSLQGVFYCFRSIEKTQVQTFEEEFSRHKKQNTQFDSTPLEKIKEEYPDYIFRKIAPKFAKALNYILESQKNNKNSW